MFLAASANFAHAQTGSGFQFVNVTPCRIADTRLATGPFGGPELSAGSTREFDIPQSACNIPSTAVAYSLNVTVVPNASLGYLTIWSTGQSQPLVPTLTSDGRVKADAAIVPAGSNGGVDVYVTDATQVVLDIDGYFAPAGTTSALAFYPVTPCRVADTRNATGPLGGPKLAAYTSRDFPVQAGGCGIPSTAQAYSLNVTALPQTGYLGYLTLWPTGEAQPLVSTLNSLTGEIVANAAIVPAGAGGDVSIFVTNDADVVLDIDGYFAPPETGGLSLYTVSPCRVMDTRNGAGAFSGTLTINVTGSACAPPSTAQAYVFNVTAAPSGNLAYLTLWPNGGTQPSTSTLQSPDGTVTSNMAVVATTNGSINAYATDPTQLSLDISGYFAPTTSGSTWDSGVITLTVNGVVAASTNYQQGSTPSTIAEGLQSGLTAASPVNVTAIGDGIYLQAKQSGSETNYGYTLTTTSYDSADFGQSSFMNPAATGNLSGGQDAASGQTQIVYSYTAGYDNVGNVINYADSVMGSWQFGYNALNELTSSQNTTVTSTSTQFAGMYGCWSYDDFGNRTAAAMSTTPCNSNPPLQSWATYTTTNTNRMDSTSLNSNQVSGYDAAGDVIYDGRNQYLYDPEGRICAVSFTVSGATTLTGYLYDTDGNRVAKGTLLSWGSCDPAVNGFQTTAVYVGGPSGEQMTEMAVRNNEVTPAHTNVWEGGALLATYDWINGGLHFALADPLGSKRVQVSGTGEAELDCLSLPFGDNLGNAPECVQAGTVTAADATEHHFTGKERDTESGNDYFGARYYGSSMGRFLSPDPVIITPERLTNPQQLNLYAYVANNPLRFIDPTGEILQCVGDAKSQSQCFSDLQQIAGDAANRLSMDAKTGVVSFDTKDLDMSKNEGAALVNDLVGSKNTYDFSVGPTIMTDKGPVRVDKISTDLANLPTFGDQPKSGNPPAGVSDILDIYFSNPNMTRVSNTNLQVAPEWTVAFHELAEAFEKIDGGKGNSYAAGHNAALQREMILRDQRPYLKQYNTGAGGPANSPNPQGGIIIKK